MFDCTLKAHLLPPTCNPSLEVSILPSPLHFPISAVSSSQDEELIHMFHVGHTRGMNMANNWSGFPLGHSLTRIKLVIQIGLFR